MKGLRLINGILTLTLFLTSAGLLATSHEASKLPGQVLEVVVTDEGFTPAILEAKTNIPTTLKVTRKTDQTCAKQVMIKGSDKKYDLPLNQTVAVDLGVLKQGEIRFGCSMGMMMSAVINAK